MEPCCLLLPFKSGPKAQAQPHFSTSSRTYSICTSRRFMPPVVLGVSLSCLFQPGTPYLCLCFVLNCLHVMKSPRHLCPRTVFSPCSSVLHLTFRVLAREQRPPTTSQLAIFNSTFTHTHSAHALPALLHFSIHTFTLSSLLLLHTICKNIASREVKFSPN